MIYNEQQFERFSKPPFKYERQQVIDTHTEVRTAINTYFDRQAIKEKYDLAELPDLDPFLQGSYKNDTNVTQSSDVDVVVRLKTVWRADKSTLSIEEVEKYNKSTKTSQYTFANFNSDILFCLQKHFGSQNVINDNKCIRIKPHSEFCDADVIPALTYKLYGAFPSSEGQKFTEGICFDTNEGKTVVNFPKEHQQSLIEKSNSTNGNFKETVRMFKNLKDELIEKGLLPEHSAKSYFIENLLFNVPDNLFSGLYKDRFHNVLENLITDFNSGKVNNYYCANKVHKLLADNTWHIDSMKQFLISLCIIRDKNEF